LFRYLIGGVIAFALVVVTMLTFIVYFANRNSKPTHIKIDGSMISARRHKRLLWTVKISELAYEATIYDDELRRTFYLYDNGLLRGRFSFVNYEMTQYKVFLEQIANYLKKDVNLFYRETYGKEISIRTLSENSFVDANPKSFKKLSLINLLFRSLFSMVTTKNPNNESLGTHKKSVQYARGVFWLIFLFALVQVWFLFSYERPFYITQFPTEKNLIVNQGTLVEVHKRKTPTTLLLTTVEGKKIPLDYTYTIHKVLNSESPKQVYASVWWFPLNGSSLGWIGKMEVNGLEIMSIEEQKKGISTTNRILFYRITKYLFFFIYCILSLDVGI
jgi:hypothetical protein